MNYLTTALSDIPWVRHGFFSRQGGVSDGIYGTLNCGPGSSDKADFVAVNRARIGVALGLDAAAVLTPRQVHSNKVFYVDRALPYDDMPAVDALVTDKPGIGIGILTADCAPVLFACRTKKIVGAAHAGWKGALNGVLEATLDQMKTLGAVDIAAALGPCIRAASYEVSDEFKEPFLKAAAANDVFFKPAARAGHLMFDLAGYVRQRLEAAGVRDFYDTEEDTLPQEDRFFSYRRTCHRREPDYGRQMSIIAIR